MMTFIGGCLFELFVQVLMYGLGRFVISIVSFNRARAIGIKEFFSNDRPAYDEEGKMLVPEWAAMIIGVMTLFASVALFTAFRS
ncbi:hypothetical protein [Duganella aceris]|uniref:Uncharacterized protein n=1 Tax=Duganella aceris TaxID=2703883 RepID=A0ABX0FM06_9BURK|nr:hypothetical protein [Duganella aceris]NGZ85474.1 hypothetical protein [Duganella aceris]